MLSGLLSWGWIVGMIDYYIPSTISFLFPSALPPAAKPHGYMNPQQLISTLGQVLSGSWAKAALNQLALGERYEALAIATGGIQPRHRK